jgi:hypothetical protein
LSAEDPDKIGELHQVSYYTTSLFYTITEYWRKVNIFFSISSCFT